MIPISVILPVYNAEKYLAESIESILNQTYQEFEFLIFNDGSNDNSSRIIQEYSKWDSRITVYNDDVNRGYVIRLNEGLKLARGKYIARMDADDIALPVRFEQQLRFLEKHEEVGVCGSNYRQFGEKEKNIYMPENHQEIAQLMLYGNGFCHPSVMIKKSVLGDLTYNSSCMPFEDFALWANLVDITRFYNIQDILLRYRVHKKNISRIKRSRNLIEERKKIQIQYLKKYYSKTKFTYSELGLLSKVLTEGNKLNADELKNMIMVINRISKGGISKKQLEFLKERFFLAINYNVGAQKELLKLYFNSGLRINKIFLELKLFIKGIVFQ